MTVRHSLLTRQLKRLFGRTHDLPEAWQPLLEAVDRTYHDADVDRRMLERSLDLSSQELLEANAQLRRGYADLERRVEERTADLIAANQALREQMLAQLRLEDQLRQSQKMEAIGRLAGGIAHDFNNLLTVITGFSALLQHQLQPDSASWRTVEEIRQAADRAAGLTRQLLAFSRRQVLQPRVLDLNTVIEQMQQLLQRLLGENVTLVTTLAPDLGLVRADPGQVDQVIVNLAVNARDAMAGGGRLIIETANADFDGPSLAQHADMQDGRQVMLAVTDTGPGMTAETQARIFEPFFTTKGSGEGTGLGLATVYGIVKQSGGTISVYSEIGRGSSFKVYLPRLDETADAAAAPRDPAAEDATTVSRGETILLVEDEDAVRRLARLVLEERGYTVLAASNCHEAMQWSRRHAGPIHLLLTDVVMPDGSGRVIAEQIVADREETKVLYMSGYTDNTLGHHGILNTGIAFLQKPFTAPALTRKVRDVIDS
jgi:signal transduction histidine kinase